MNIDACHSSIDMDWRTPEYVLDAVRSIHNTPIAYDPCTTADNPTRAASYSTPKENGLRTEWYKPGCPVFVNPPYGRALPLWTMKAAAEADIGAEICLLVAARTETLWFRRDIVPYASCLAFFNQRVRFLRPDGTQGDSPAFPSVMAYYGPHTFKFQQAFRHLAWYAKVI